MKLQRVVYRWGFKVAEDAEELDGGVILQVEYADGATEAYAVHGVEKVTVVHYPEGLPQDWKSVPQEEAK